VSFPDYEALRFESQPMISGAATRLMLLRRGAGVERERILALIEVERDLCDEDVDLDLDLDKQCAYHESQAMSYLIAKIKGDGE
jgi:hypothetical protein